MAKGDNRVKISNRTVEAAKPGEKRYTLWDTEISGFGLRVEPSGVKSFLVRYRAGGGRLAPERLMVLGRLGALTPIEARNLAKAKMGEVATGGDPAKARADRRRDMTIADLSDLYLEEGVDHKKAGTILNDKSRISRHIKPLLGTKTVKMLSKEDVARFQRDIAAGKTATSEHTKKGGRSAVTGGKRAAALCVNLLSAMYSFAIDRKFAPENPCAGVKRYAMGSKERYLTTEELERLGAAIREAETAGIEWVPDPDKKTKHAPKPENRRVKVAQHVAGAFRLLILTGCRLREILHLKWSDLDIERGLLLLSDSKTGRRAIVLSAPALAVLVSLPRVGVYVIAGETAGAEDEKPRSDLNRPWFAIRRRAGLDDVRIHDLRHSFASVGAGAGLGLPIVGALLGHSQPRTTQRYAHLDNDPLRRATNRIGDEIARAMGDAPAADPATVTPLRRKQ